MKEWHENSVVEMKRVSEKNESLCPTGWMSEVKDKLWRKLDEVSVQR